jgi:hypothetical protein
MDTNVPSKILGSFIKGFMELQRCLTLALATESWLDHVKTEHSGIFAQFTGSVAGMLLLFTPNEMERMHPIWPYDHSACRSVLYAAMQGTINVCVHGLQLASA